MLQLWIAELFDILSQSPTMTSTQRRNSQAVNFIKKTPNNEEVNQQLLTANHQVVHYVARPTAKGLLPTAIIRVKAGNGSSVLVPTAWTTSCQLWSRSSIRGHQSSYFCSWISFLYSSFDSDFEYPLKISFFTSFLHMSHVSKRTVEIGLTFQVYGWLIQTAEVRRFLMLSLEEISLHICFFQIFVKDLLLLPLRRRLISSGPYPEKL